MLIWPVQNSQLMCGGAVSYRVFITDLRWHEKQRNYEQGFPWH